jgi:hypothetical protein
MTSFDLPQNFTQDPESLLRKVQPHVVPPQILFSTAKPVVIAPSTSNAMVSVGPFVNIGVKNFEIKMGLITMVQASPLYGKANEDASAHLQQFLELCNTFVIKGVTQVAIRL